MNGESTQNTRIAVLVDADNASPAHAAGLLAEVAKYGVSSVRRVYGDWTTPQLAGWKKVLTEHSLQPMQQFRNTTGKNATDSALIIDAMDLLHSKRFGGFCLVSSDSDFTSLARRIREEGLFVIGIGERRTPQSFVAACDRFVFNDVLTSAAEPTTHTPKKVAKDLKSDKKLIGLLRSAIETNSDEAGWCNLGAVGNNMAKLAPEFDQRNYGYKKLSELIESIGLFEIRRTDKATHLREKRPAQK